MVLYREGGKESGGGTRNQILLESFKTHHMSMTLPTYIQEFGSTGAFILFVSLQVS